MLHPIIEFDKLDSWAKHIIELLSEDQTNYFSEYQAEKDWMLDENPYRPLDSPPTPTMDLVNRKLQNFLESRDFRVRLFHCCKLDNPKTIAVEGLKLHDSSEIIARFWLIARGDHVFEPHLDAIKKILSDKQYINLYSKNRSGRVHLTWSAREVRAPGCTKFLTHYGGEFLRRLFENRNLDVANLLRGVGQSTVVIVDLPMQGFDKFLSLKLQKPFKIFGFACNMTIHIVSEGLMHAVMYQYLLTLFRKF